MWRTIFFEFDVHGKTRESRLTVSRRVKETHRPHADRQT